jgi:hypothetical protein
MPNPIPKPPNALLFNLGVLIIGGGLLLWAIQSGFVLKLGNKAAQQSVKLGF